MAEIIGGVDMEKYWWVFKERVIITDSHYFDNEEEAKAFAKEHCLSIEPPESEYPFDRD